MSTLHVVTLVACLVWTVSGMHFNLKTARRLKRFKTLLSRPEHEFFFSTCCIWLGPLLFVKHIQKSLIFLFRA